MEARVEDYHRYRELFGRCRVDSDFIGFCHSHGVQVEPVVRENKNSKLVQGTFFFGKKIPMEAEDFRVLNKDNEIPLASLLEGEYTVWREIFIHQLLNTLLLRRCVPHFPFFYGRCFDEEKHVIVLLERMDQDLQAWAQQQDRSDREWVGCFVQLFFALLALQKYTRVSHTDLHWGNVLVKTLPRPLTWCYRVSPGEYYCLRNQRHLFSLCDFGFARFDREESGGTEDFEHLCLNVFDWLGRVPPNKTQTLLRALERNRGTTMTVLLHNVISEHTEPVQEGIVYDLSVSDLEFDL